MDVHETHTLSPVTAGWWRGSRITQAHQHGCSTFGPVTGRVAAEQWEAKPLGTYDVVLDTPDHPISVTITISETSGKLVALFWPASDDQGQMMDATVIGTDLVLSANTRRGAFELNIERRGKGLSGFWMLGNKQGRSKAKSLPDCRVRELKKVRANALTFLYPL